MSAHPESDPVAVEVCRNALVGVADEMGVIMKRAAFSPMIKERNDRSCAVFTPALELVAQAEHLPIHLALLISAVPAAIRSLGEDQLGPGDVLIHNDPYLAGSHLPDFTTIMPVYVNDTLIAYTAVIAHMTDVGGSVPGGLGTARDIFEEGIRVPPVRLYRSGELVKDVLDLISANVRTPDLMRGDLLAQAAANKAGEHGVQELGRRLGPDRLLSYMRQILDYTERRTRSEISRLPQGEFRFSDFLDDDGFSDEPVPIHAAIHIGAGSISVDYSGSAEQRRGPVNTALAVTTSATYFVVRCLIDPTIPTTSGCFRSVRVMAPERSVLNADFPAPVGGGSLETAQRVVDVLLGALSEALPEAVTAAGIGGHNTISFGGQWPQSSRTFVITENVSGGGGARSGHDGLNASRINLMNTPNNPIEVFEREAPLLIERYEIRPGSGGDGKYRGGLGTVKQYQSLAHARVSILSDRHRHRPWGLFGGEPGSSSRHWLLRQGAGRTLLASKVNLTLDPGDSLVAATAGGGGYGLPSERSPVARQADVLDGYVASSPAETEHE